MDASKGILIGESASVEVGGDFEGISGEDFVLNGTLILRGSNNSFRVDGYLILNSDLSAQNLMLDVGSDFKVTETLSIEGSLKAEINGHFTLPIQG